tara:strand:+ start:564 stop:716 length:153 start_codon:yes stop_codon:yes gene_type:complete
MNYLAGLGMTFICCFPIFGTIFLFDWASLFTIFIPFYFLAEAAAAGAGPF